MRVVITGATGFVGTGVLAEALEAEQVQCVVLLSRTSVGVVHPKLIEVLVDDFGDLRPAAQHLADIDGCLWCLGTSAVGLDEATYTRITHTYALHAARYLSETNPGVIFCFLSGSGADGNAMWARVKKRTEDDLRALNLAGLVIFRPVFIRGFHGAKLRGLFYRSLYYAGLLVSPIARLFGGATSNKEIGLAMISAVRERLNNVTLDSKQINKLARPCDS